MSVLFISRKRLVILIILLCLVAGGILFYFFDAYPVMVHVMPADKFTDLRRPPEGSVEELYQDIFMIFLLPPVEEAVEEYYGVPYTVAPYLTDVLSVERPHGYRTYTFRIKLRIFPYTGPHNCVGEDHVTLLAQAGPRVIVEKFEHIKDLGP